MVYLILPRGSDFGWGVCGKYLVKELSKYTQVKYITDSFGVEDIGDELDYHFLRSKVIGEAEYNSIISGRFMHVDSPVLQAIPLTDFLPWKLRLKGSSNVGYTFFEINKLDPNCIQNARENFDIVVAGSTWCEQVLKNHGLETTVTIIQGIDPLVFNPLYAEKEFFKDRFVVFSGGKFEFRKGQDVVIRAYKVIQDRHEDVMLVNSWFNGWIDSMKTMSASSYIRFNMGGNNCISTINKTLHENGIDLNRVITLPPRSHYSMARIYQNTDIGLFPNRCEGGTNLVLMEYMACGKPVIASFNSGHRDVVNERNAILIRQMKSLIIRGERKSVMAVWDEPDLEETVSHLEWAYQHRDELKSLGGQAGRDMKQLTWERTAGQFYQILEQMSHLKTHAPAELNTADNRMKA